MNYIPIHTNITPSYNYLLAENAFLKQDIEYKNNVICDQQGLVAGLKKDVDELSQANMKLKAERDKYQADADRWRVMKNIIRSQGNEQQLYTVQKVVDKDLERGRTAGLERCVGRSAGVAANSSSSPNR